MSYSIHHVPGRLRVKSPVLKRKEREAAQTLINTLRSLGHVHPEHGHALHYQGPGLGQKLSDTVVNKLVETVLERSATALVAAIF